MKNYIYIFTLLLIFIVFSLFVKYCPLVTIFDINVTIALQRALSYIPVKYPVFADKTGYYIMLVLPLIAGAIHFVKIKKLSLIPLFVSVPVFMLFFNKLLIKPFFQRLRPPIDLQISWVHPHSFSYVSTHTLTTFCIYGLVIIYLYNNCKNEYVKYIGITVSLLWIFFTGLSRVWIGVHYFTDVAGACILGLIMVLLYAELYKLVKGK